MTLFSVINFITKCHNTITFFSVIFSELKNYTIFILKKKKKNSNQNRSIVQELKKKKKSCQALYIWDFLSFSSLFSDDINHSNIHTKTLGISLPLHCPKSKSNAKIPISRNPNPKMPPCMQRAIDMRNSCCIRSLGDPNNMRYYLEKDDELFTYIAQRYIFFFPISIGDISV